jgi:hypothetical protein
MVSMPGCTTQLQYEWAFGNLCGYTPLLNLGVSWQPLSRTKNASNFPAFFTGCKVIKPLPKGFNEFL